MVSGATTAAVVAGCVVVVGRVVVVGCVVVVGRVVVGLILVGRVVAVVGCGGSERVVVVDPVALDAVVGVPGAVVMVVVDGSSSSPVVGGTGTTEVSSDVDEVLVDAVVSADDGTVSSPKGSESGSPPLTQPARSIAKRGGSSRCRTPDHRRFEPQH